MVSRFDVAVAALDRYVQTTSGDMSYKDYIEALLRFSEMVPAISYVEEWELLLSALKRPVAK